MKFSIISCTWNSIKYLKESVDSVLMQDYGDIEYIFVDGGSADGTLEFISKIDRPIKILNEVRGGISRAMNEGVRVATGDVVAHLHSDDFYLDPYALSSVANVLESKKAGWCYGRIKRMVNGHLVPETFIAPKYSPERLLRGNFIPHPATFVRRDWMLRAGCFDESRRYAMDYDLWLKLREFGAPAEMEVPLAAFRVHDGSLSSSNRLAAMEEDYRVRIAHAGRNRFHLAEHFLRYWVRRCRLGAKLITDDLFSK